MIRAALAVLGFAAGAASAGDFSVNPVRMELGASARTGVFTIRNDGKDRLSFQVQGMAWTQDAQGRDVYAEGGDLVYFPRLVSVEPGQEAVVRVGVRQPLVPTEKTYRLFVEELPPADAAPLAGSQVRVLVRFGPPIFVKPAQAQDRLEVENLRVEGGEVRLALRNAGNQHQVVDSIRLKGNDGRGGEVFATTLADRYLLAGTVKEYAATLTREQCRALARVSAEAKTDKTLAQRQLEVRATACP